MYYFRGISHLSVATRLEQLTNIEKNTDAYKCGDGSEKGRFSFPGN